MTSYRLLERRSVMLHGLISGNVTLEKDDVHVHCTICILLSDDVRVSQHPTISYSQTNALDSELHSKSLEQTSAGNT